jgi:hypothetical protein
MANYKPLSAEDVIMPTVSTALHSLFHIDFQWELRFRRCRTIRVKSPDLAFLESQRNAGGDAGLESRMCKTCGDASRIQFSLSPSPDSYRTNPSDNNPTPCFPILSPAPISSRTPQPRLRFFLVSAPISFFFYLPLPTILCASMSCVSRRDFNIFLR